MTFAMFYHSLVSCWNHGNAHFLRGVVAELLDRGHEVRVLEPEAGWSRSNMLAERSSAVADFRAYFPDLRSSTYTLDTLDLDAVLADVDVVLVHEWNEPELVARVGAHRERHDYTLLFHDTHHRIVTAAHEMARFDLTWYDGVLAFGNVIRDMYLARGWTKRAWTWHEAADVRLFRPLPATAEPDDLVWVGNFGDDERTAELREYLIKPVAELGLTASVFGVRYPDAAKAELAGAGIHYGGWLPNHRAPAAFAAHRVTVHVPRRPYARALPGIPTIRVFEALACGIPLVSAPWQDAEHLFTPGEDFLVARDGPAMAELLRLVLSDLQLADGLARRGLATIRARHTCGHRVNELLDICEELARPGGRSGELRRLAQSA